VVSIREYTRESTRRVIGGRDNLMRVKSLYVEEFVY
jgi:hypothetical protein